LSGNQKLDAKDAPLPSRCIDVRGELLILRETAGKTGSYMTFSHRWNAETELSRTTVDNYEDRKRGFSLDDLSKTFKDFVWVARQLDMAYVWIDSICIIQGDDSQDWTQEAGKMAEYYQRSLLTIAATSSSQEEGLFPFQPPIFERRLARLPYRDEDGVQRGYFYVYPVASINGEYESHVRGSALLRRGWVFQEWLLSRRVICFTRSGIFFECQTELPRNGHREMLKVPNKKKDRKEVELTLKAVFSFDKERPEDLWWDIVEAYSVYELTFPGKDRLLALSGIAAEFSEATRRKTAVKGRREGRDGLAHVDVYVSGLWLNDITRGLLWQQKGSPGGCQRASGMPTWSWTSLLGPVAWAGIKGSPPATKAIEVLGLSTPDGAVYPAPPPDTSPALPNPADVIAPTHSTPVVESYYGVSSCFTGLLVEGRISAILAWDLYTCRNLDEMSNPVIGTSNGEAYRKIASHLRPRDICGWGSFEHTDFQTQLAFWDGQTTYALHISTSKTGNGLLRRGLLGSGGSTYNVVFIRKVCGSKYSRVGVGVLWGKEVMAEFSSLEPQVLELV
jgi:hypothetical protein